MDDFQKNLRIGAEQCVAQQRSPADHVIRQAFFEGIRWYMEYLRNTPPAPIIKDDQL